MTNRDVEDSPLSKLSQATIETIETPPETERSSLEADKLFLSQARPHDPPEVTRLQRLHNTGGTRTGYHGPWSLAAGERELSSDTGH